MKISVTLNKRWLANQNVSAQAVTAALAHLGKVIVTGLNAHKLGEKRQWEENDGRLLRPYFVENRILRETLQNADRLTATFSSMLHFSVSLDCLLFRRGTSEAIGRYSFHFDKDGNLVSESGS